MFRNIADLDGLANDAIRVKHFGTMDLIESHPDVPALEVLALMTANDFDIVPISDGDQQLGFVSKAEIKQLHDSEPIHKVIHPINKAVMVSPNASLQEAFEKLATSDGGRLFVGEANKLQGIVTFEDLGKPAVSLYLLAKILMIESGLRRLLGSYTDTPISDAPSKDSDYEEPSYIRDVLKLIKKKSPLLVKDLGFVSKNKASNNQFDEGFNFINDLRNDLAHGRSILSNTTDVSDALKRIKKIDLRLEQISKLINDRNNVWEAFAKTHIVKRTVTVTEDFWVGKNAIQLPLKTPIFVITASNPLEEVLSKEKNSRRNQSLRDLLEYRKLDFVEVVGQSPDGKWSENSFAIEGMTRLEACKLAKDFSQRAVFELESETVKVISITGKIMSERDRNRNDI